MTGSGSKLKYGFVLAALALAFSQAAAGQTVVSPPAAPAPRPIAKADMPPMPGESVERSIKVDPSINLSLCVTEGTLKVNGWNRNELRVYVQDGSNFEFKTQQTSPRSGDPVWVMINAFSGRNKAAPRSECIRGGDIEIDVMLNDVVLPGGVNGRAMAESVSGHRRALRVLFMSGYTDHAALESAVRERGTRFLQKPFAPEALAGQVREILDGVAD